MPLRIWIDGLVGKLRGPGAAREAEGFPPPGIAGSDLDADCRESFASLTEQLTKDERTGAMSGSCAPAGSMPGMHPAPDGVGISGPMNAFPAFEDLTGSEGRSDRARRILEAVEGMNGSPDRDVFPEDPYPHESDIALLVLSESEARIEKIPPVDAPLSLDEGTEDDIFLDSEDGMDDWFAPEGDAAIEFADDDGTDDWPGSGAGETGGNPDLPDVRTDLSSEYWRHRAESAEAENALLKAHLQGLSEEKRKTGVDDFREALFVAGRRFEEPFLGGDGAFRFDAIGARLKELRGAMRWGGSEAQAWVEAYLDILEAVLWPETATAAGSGHDALLCRVRETRHRAQAAMHANTVIRDLYKGAVQEIEAERDFDEIGGYQMVMQFTAILLEGHRDLLARLPEMQEEIGLPALKTHIVRQGKSGVLADLLGMTEGDILDVQGVGPVSMEKVIAQLRATKLPLPIVVKRDVMEKTGTKIAPDNPAIVMEMLSGSWFTRMSGAWRRPHRSWIHRHVNETADRIMDMDATSFDLS